MISNVVVLVVYLTLVYIQAGGIPYGHVEQHQGSGRRNADFKGRSRFIETEGHEKVAAHSEEGSREREGDDEEEYNGTDEGRDGGLAGRRAVMPGRMTTAFQGRYLAKISRSEEEQGKAREIVHMDVLTTEIFLEEYENSNL